MTQTMSDALTTITGRLKPDKMVTLVCSSCKMALYMSERVLHMPSWKCPSCGAVTRTKL